MRYVRTRSDIRWANISMNALEGIGLSPPRLHKKHPNSPKRLNIAVSCNTHSSDALKQPYSNRAGNYTMLGVRDGRVRPPSYVTCLAAADSYHGTRCCKGRPPWFIAHRSLGSLSHLALEFRFLEGQILTNQTSMPALPPPLLVDFVICTSETVSVSYW